MPAARGAARRGGRRSAVEPCPRRSHLCSGAPSRSLNNGCRNAPIGWVIRLVARRPPNWCGGRPRTERARRQPSLGGQLASRGHRPSQRGPGFEETPFGGADWDLEDRCHGRQRTILEVVKRDDRALLDREGVKCTLERFHIHQPFDRCFLVNSICRDVVDGDNRHARPPPHRHPAGVHDDTAEPGVEPLGVMQGGQRAPGRDECLLDGILGFLGGTQDRASQPKRGQKSQVNEPGERIRVAVHRTRHEASLLAPAGRKLPRNPRLRPPDHEPPPQPADGSVVATRPDPSRSGVGRSGAVPFRSLVYPSGRPGQDLFVRKSGRPARLRVLALAGWAIERYILRARTLLGGLRPGFIV